jgi:hypothetical protein
VDEARQGGDVEEKAVRVPEARLRAYFVPVSLAYVESSALVEWQILASGSHVGRWARR